MNRATNKDIAAVGSATNLNVSPSHGVSRISIGSGSLSNKETSHGATTGGNQVNISSNNSTLMNGSGELVYRRSPVSQNHLNHNQTSTHNYYTLGSPSITTSYNSEEISDTINSSFLDEEGNISDSLCVKVDQLQQQVEALTESQASQEERYKRTRQENDDLLNRIHSLEDQLRELEIQSETRSRENEKRFRETMAKQMKTKMQECEQHVHTNLQLQQDIIALNRDLLKSESLVKALRSEKESLELELAEKSNELSTQDEEIHKLKLVVKQLKDEESVKSNLINILNEEFEENHNRSQHHSSHVGNSTTGSYTNNNNSISKTNKQPQTSSPKQLSTNSRRSSVTSGFNDDISSSKALKDIDMLEANLDKLRDENKRLRETNEELQAQLLNVQLEEGRSLIQEGNKSYSLADEMGDIDVQKLMEALKGQQDDNARLRKYIDDILLKIVENNPEILEKTTPVNSSDRIKSS